MQYKRCSGGGYTRTAGGAVEGCDCGCPTCDCSATGDVLLGTPHNGAKTPLNSNTFPRWPRYSWTQGAIVPTTIMAHRCARIFIYPCATHDGTTYTVSNTCRSIMTTGYSPVFYRRGNNNTSYDAYSIRSQRHGRDYDGASSDYYANVLDDSLQPNKLGSGTNSLYGWLIGYGMDHPFVPTPANLSAIYSILAADLGGSMPAAGVPHTLVLYIRFWRETYKTLNWDGVSWPWWWDNQGIHSDFRSFTPHNQGPPRTKDIQKGAGLWGAASDPTTAADSRALLLGAHILCTPPTASTYITSNIAGILGRPARDTWAFFLSGGLNQDLPVQVAYPNSMLLKPTTMDAGITIGDPFPFGGSSVLYYVPLTFSGAGTWHLDFGGVRTVTVTLS